MNGLNDLNHDLSVVFIMIYLLFLICIIIYYGKMMYRNYQKELPLVYGQNEIVYFIILFCIIIGQYTIPSIMGRLIAILMFGFTFFLIYTIIGLHNKKKHSGNLFLFYQKEIVTAQIRICIGTGIVLLALFLINFID